MRKIWESIGKIRKPYNYLWKFWNSSLAGYQSGPKRWQNFENGQITSHRCNIGSICGSRSRRPVLHNLGTRRWRVWFNPWGRLPTKNYRTRIEGFARGASYNILKKNYCQGHNPFISDFEYLQRSEFLVENLKNYWWIKCYYKCELFAASTVPDFWSKFWGGKL